jgi:hypothetical protein
LIEAGKVNGQLKQELDAALREVARLKDEYEALKIQCAGLEGTVYGTELLIEQAVKVLQGKLT